jgi:hypothetical protein
MSLISIIVFLIVYWHFKHLQVHDTIILEQTSKIAELEQRLAALNSATGTVRKAGSKAAGKAGAT